VSKPNYWLFSFARFDRRAWSIELDDAGGGGVAIPSFIFRDQQLAVEVRRALRARGLPTVDELMETE
jgi:hypothetical protein